MGSYEAVAERFVELTLKDGLRHRRQYHCASPRVVRHLGCAAWRIILGLVSFFRVNHDSSPRIPWPSNFSGYINYECRGT